MWKACPGRLQPNPAALPLMQAREALGASGDLEGSEAPHDSRLLPIPGVQALLFRNRHCSAAQFIAVRSIARWMISRHPPPPSPFIAAIIWPPPPPPASLT